MRGGLRASRAPPPASPCDPGRGLPPAQAGPRPTEAASRARSPHRDGGPAALPLGSNLAEEQEGRALFERFRSVARRKAAAAATSPEEQQRLNEMHEKLAAQERDRKTREKIQALKQRLHNRQAPTRPN